MATTLLEEPGKSPRKPGTTLLNQGGGGTRLVPTADEAAGPAPSDRKDDPIVAWLAVIAGPGRGGAVELGYGMNAIGRDAGNRVTLNFGDDQISAEDHFRIAYDDQSREYHLIPAKGTNLVYVDGKAILVPTALQPMTDIKVGATTLRFVPLCGPAWDYADQAK